MNPNHFKKVVSSGADPLTVDGEYFSVTVRRFILSSEIVAEHYLDKTSAATLVEVAVTNHKEYRMRSSACRALIIDSDGFQHSQIDLTRSAYVLSSCRLPPNTPLPSPAEIIEGHARIKGWIAYPQLENGAVPHRFIYQHGIFPPGETSGHLLATETLEIVFDLSVFGRILDDEAK